MLPLSTLTYVPWHEVHDLGILPCSCTCSVPWDRQKVDVEAVIRDARASVSCIDLVVLRGARHESTISAGQEGATIQGLKETEGCVDSGTTVSLGELECSSVVVHVVALASRYQGILDDC